ncbi:Glycine betaine/carnitine/choline transport system permease protein OpuCB [Candidatus Rubidus massiliensis]|nr:Glycine betaine/carnitine/choline transport system permease protein OpuCB [Candidatus Rubidus massiliensis]
MLTIFKYFLALNILLAIPLVAEKQLNVGSKRFTESYILAEIIVTTAKKADEAKIFFKPGLGNTGIVFAALQSGVIDLYPDYTGTIVREILHAEPQYFTDLEEIRKKLKPMGFGITNSLGFSNSYALAIARDLADKLQIRKISDLQKYPHLNLGFSQEFLGRTDGWQGLKEVYALSHELALGIDHSLAYEALEKNQIDVTDVYTTDPKIQKYNLILLQDDKHFFPSYQAVIIYRLDIPTKCKETWKEIQKVIGSIDKDQMIAMNQRAEEGEDFATIAQDFLDNKGAIFVTKEIHETFWQKIFDNDLWNLTYQHFYLTFLSLFVATLIGIPLGIIAAKYNLFSQAILTTISVVQTIPSLALFAFLIPILGQIGTVPALIALSLYALLPIVRNTYMGLKSIPVPIQESAIALGLSDWFRLLSIDVPLASPSIMTGIQTAAVINVGMATIAALIGAGGYGERIISGLALNDYSLLLAGAIPACIFALIVQYGFDFFNKYIIPKGLQKEKSE